MKMDAVCRVDAREVEMILHALSQRGESLGEYLRHQKQRWAGIETIPVARQSESSPARRCILLNNSDLMALSRQSAGNRQSADSGADDQYGFHE